MKNEVKTINDVMKIVKTQWKEFVEKECKKSKFAGDFYNYIYNNDGNWDESFYIEDNYFEDEKYWIEQYQNPKFVDKDLLTEFTGYFLAVYINWKENR
jgi:predicted nucleic-acid-binding Zn-ribbon protein